MITFPGIQSAIYVQGTVSRGISPAAFVVTCIPIDNPSLGPGALTIQGPGSETVSFPDALPHLPYRRQALARTDRQLSHQRWSLTILDHRWRWQYGSISGEYNKRLPDGTVDTNSKKTPQELATLCLQAMGETGFNVGNMPDGVFPYANWQNKNPAQALWDLCERVACEICGGEFAAVKIHRRGVGLSLPIGGQPMHSPYRFAIPSKPNKIIVRCGPNIFQGKLKLEAVGQETDGVIKKIDNLSYKPTSWATESPISFASLTGDSLRAAQESVWKWYQVTGQHDGSLPVPGCNETISKVDQYFPLRDGLLESANDLDSIKRSLPAYVEGEFWPYSDDASNTAAATRFLGKIKIIGERGLVVFDYPVFGLSSTGAIQAPTTFYLRTTHRVRKTDGSYAGVERSQTIGGNGAELVLQCPEIFGTIKEGGTSTVEQAQTEADKYLECFANSFQGEFDDREYAGILTGQTDGNVAQYRYQGGLNRPFLTRASTFAEFDIYTPSKAEKRRRNLVETLA